MMNTSEIKLIGGNICLDFINTLHDRSLENSFDYIGEGYPSLLNWCEYAGVWDRATLLNLQTLKNDEIAKNEAFQTVIELRAILFGLFSAIADDGPLSSADLSGFNCFLSETLLHKRIVTNNTQLTSAWDLSTYRFDMLLWPVVEAAYQLLIGGDHQKIKKCPACGWIFIDKSKGGRRRWCSMDTCGTIDKSRRYYHGKVKDQKSN